MYVLVTMCPQGFYSAGRSFYILLCRFDVPGLRIFSLRLLCSCLWIIRAYVFINTGWSHEGVCWFFNCIRVGTGTESSFLSV